MAQIVVVDDQASMCQMLEADLTLRDFEVATFTSPNEAFESLKRNPCDVLLTDLNMPGLNGVELCQMVVQNWPGIPVVVMTAFGSMETAIAAIRAGAYDYVTKPVEMDMLALTLERAARHRALQEQVRRLSEAVRQTQRFDDLLGASPPMQALYDQLQRIAPTETSVLITGESGTGKELVAKALHERGTRKDGPFVAINCAALPETLLESELFGHTSGAFTDARSQRKGLFQQACGGTLFLDEIGDFPLATQAKLLRVLEQQTVRPVGGDEEIPVDVRLLSATNRDLEAAVDEGRFREDLFFRINVIQVELPPLRARGADILLLAQSFSERFAARSHKEVTGFSEPVADKLLAYNWPGNVRELRNVIERAVALTRFERLVVEDLPEKIRDYRRAQWFVAGDDPQELPPLEDVERRYILHVLEATGNNKTLTARVLGLDRKTLYRKLQQYGQEGS